MRGSNSPCNNLPTNPDGRTDAVEDHITRDLLPSQKLTSITTRKFADPDLENDDTGGQELLSDIELILGYANILEEEVGESISTVPITQNQPAVRAA